MPLTKVSRQACPCHDRTEFLPIDGLVIHFLFINCVVYQTKINVLETLNYLLHRNKTIITCLASHISKKSLLNCFSLQQKYIDKVQRGQVLDFLKQIQQLGQFLSVFSFRSLLNHLEWLSFAQSNKLKTF